MARSQTRCRDERSFRSSMPPTWFSARLGSIFVLLLPIPNPLNSGWLSCRMNKPPEKSISRPRRHRLRYDVLFFMPPTCSVHTNRRQGVLHACVLETYFFFFATLCGAPHLRSRSWLRIEIGPKTAVKRLNRYEEQARVAPAFCPDLPFRLVTMPTPSYSSLLLHL